MAKWEVDEPGKPAAKKDAIDIMADLKRLVDDDGDVLARASLRLITDLRARAEAAEAREKALLENNEAERKTLIRHNAALLSWFREWPWAAQSGETLSDEECQAIRDVILERDAQAAEIAKLQGQLKMVLDREAANLERADAKMEKAEAALAAAEARVAVLEGALMDIRSHYTSDQGAYAGILARAALKRGAA